MTNPPKLSDRKIASDLWAITSYFNPIGYHRRLQNFRIFREHLEIPLVAVELSYGPAFELGAHDADILIQLRGGAVLWQKERLLNLALRALPDHCHKVAWLDCDVLFCQRGWMETASSLLDRFSVIQLFRRAHYLGPGWDSKKDWASQAEFSRSSAMSLLASGIPAAACLGPIFDDRKLSRAAGLAWSARREFLDRYLFFDLCILGGGDRAMACATHRCFDELMQSHYMNEQQRRRYIGWAAPVAQSVEAEAAFLDTEICHLWHGEIGRRAAGGRHQGFQRFQFDPDTDIAIDENGAWRWNTDKREMHDYVRGYFASRREDG
jgi:hypothetical protein